MKLLDNKRLVFILGAGASADYGYPVGSDLSKTISKNRFPILENYYPSFDIACFQQTFNKSGINSIDAFLEKKLI